MSSLSMTPSIALATLLTKQELPGAFRLEFHNKNDQVMAELYKSNILQAACSLEEVSVRRWEYELSTESIQCRIKEFLIAHRVPIATENMIERETQTSHPTPGTFFDTSSLLSHLSSSGCPSSPLSFSSSLFPSILQNIQCESEREAAGSLEEPELSVGSFSCVSPTLSSRLFSHESSFTQEMDSHKRKRTTKRTLQGKAKALRSSPSQSSPSNKSSPSRNILNFPSSDNLVRTSSPHQLVSFEILEHQLIKLDYPQQELEILLQTASREQNKRIVVDALFEHLFALEHMPALDPFLLDVRNSQSYTLLLAAIALGNQAKFEAILPFYKEKEKLYTVDPYGRNALHLAAAFGHAALIPKLIDEGFELNAKDQHGLMPLHWAIHAGHIETVQVLVTSGASLIDPWVTPDGHQYFPLELAIVTGGPATLNLLLTSDRFNQLDLAQPIQGKGTLLHLTIYADQIPMLKHLLSIHSEKIKPLFNYRDPQGRTPLQLAAYLGDVYAIYLLFKHGADLHYGTGENEGTAVHYAALGEQPAALELLYNLGAELERTNGKGQTPVVVLEGRTSISARKCKTLLARLPRLARVALTEPPKYAKRPPFNLVLQGGGPRGMAYLGALEQMEKLGTLKELKRVAGTSTGAITAAFLAIGCTTAELSIYLDQNLGRFLDAKGELEGDLLAAAQSQSYQEAVRALLKEYWGSQSTLLHPFKRAEQLKEKLQTLTGLASGDAIRNWIETIIRDKTKIKDCTFKELKGLVDSNPQTYKELHVFSICLKQGKQPQLLRFSHEDPRWDDLILSDAIRASLSIPGVFQPHILHFKDATGTRHPREHHGQFIDGGLLRNYPLTAFDDEKYQEDRYFRGEKTNRRTLGLSLRDETVYTEKMLGNISSISDLVKALVSTFYHAEYILMEETRRCKERTIEIPIQGMGLLNFPIATETKENLMTAGREATDQFFSSSILAEPSPKPKESVQIIRDRGIPWKYSIFYEFQPKIEETPEEKLKAILSSIYSAKETLSIFKVKGEQEWEFKLPLEEMYVRLGIIERSEGKVRDQQLDKHSTYLQDERIATYETIFEPKKELKLEKLFEHESLRGKERTRVYIQGAAGSGKSTLCHYIAYRWAKGDLWNSSFKYLFWIPLRNLTKERYPDTKAYTPTDLLIKEYEGEMDLRGFQTCLEQPDVRHHTLIVLDGYDELSSDAERDTASLAKAFNELKERFPHLLITSRPGSCPFERSCDLELLGFDRQGITEYIDKFFKQVQREKGKQKLEEVLKHSPHALSLARIPINLTLLCSLFCEDPTIFTSPSSLTMTFIYERIVNWLYQWFMLKRIDRGESKQTKERILEEVDLRCNSEIAKIAMALEEMAYFAMEEDTLYLERRDIERLRGWVMTSNELIDLGLLRISEGKGYFIHLTFQEFLTASKIANQYLNRKEKSRDQCRDFVRTYKFNPRFALVLYMIAGYLSLPAATNKEALQLFFDDLFAEPHDLAISYELNLLAGCFEECQDPTQIKQHPIFIRVVTEYITKLTRLGLTFRLLDRREKLLSHPKVIKTIQYLLDEPATVKGMLLRIIDRIGIAGQRLAPELIKSIVDLLKASHTKSDAAYTLGEIAQQGGPLAKEALEALIPLLMEKEDDFITKLSAANAISTIARQRVPLPEEALKALILLLKEDSSFVRGLAAEALRVVAQQETSLVKEGLKTLIPPLKEGEAYAKRSAAYALGKAAQYGLPLPKEALEALIPLLTEGDDKAKSYAASALGAIVEQEGFLPKKVLKALILLLKEGNDKAKRSAAYTLGRVAQQGTFFAKGALEALIQAIKEGDSSVKSYAVDALGIVAQQEGSLAKEALETLIQLLIEGDHDVKRSAAYTLANARRERRPFFKETLEVLTHLLIEGDVAAKSSAAAALKEVAKQGVPLSKEALEVLTHLLIEGDVAAKSSAAAALKEVAKQGVPLSKEALKGLLQLLMEGDVTAKISAAVALGAVAKQGTPLSEEILETLIPLLKEINVDVEIPAADVLGAVAQQGGPFAKKALEAFIPLLKEGDDDAKRSAATALEAVAKQGTPLPKAVLEGLIQLIKRGNHWTKTSAAAALGAVAQQGDSVAKEALEALIYLLKERDVAVAESSAYVLGAVAKQGVPLSKKALEALIPLLKEGDDGTKYYVANVLEAVAKQRIPLSKEALEGLIYLLIEGDFHAKSFAAAALGAVAKQGVPLSKEALEGLIYLLIEGDVTAKISATDALRAINKGILLKMSAEAIPLITEVCFFSDNSFSIQDRQFQISDQRTIYHSTVETKLYYEEIRESLPEILVKWRKQLDGLSFSSTPIRDRPLYQC